MAITKTLLDARGLQRPDGRVLFAYDLSPAELDELVAELRSQTPADPSSAAAFCLAAAELWRANYDGGLWTWDVVLSKLGWSHVNQGDLAALVVRGLAFWKRPVLQLMRRELLGSIAREAGIPARVLQEGGASRIRAFLQTLLAELRTFGIAHALALATQSSHRLPERLRNPTFLGLATDLALAAIDLSQILGGAKASVETLDRALPQWRSRFPLRIDDAAALELVTGLVDAARVAPAYRPLRVVTLLVDTAAGPALRRTMRLPGRIDSSDLAALVGVAVERLPPSIDLLGDHPSGPRLLALLGRRSDYYAIEPLAGPGLSSDPHVDVVLRLRAQGRILGHFVPPGGRALSALPWVFIPDTIEHNAYRLVAQGSTRFESEARVLALPGFEPDPAVLPIGAVQDRSLFHTTNHLAFDNGSDRIQLRAGAPASDDVYRWDGRHLPEAPSIFIGMPKLSRILPSGELRLVPTDRIETRVGTNWLPLAKHRFGHLDVRVRGDQGVELVDRIDVLPADARIQLEPISEGRAKVTVSMTPAPSLGVPLVPGLTKVTEASPTARVVEVTSDVNAFDVILRWADTSDLLLRLPFPRKGRRFATTQGTILSQSSLIALDDLYTVIAEAWTHPPIEKRVFQIEAALQADDQAPTPMFLGQLDPDSQGRHALPLYALTRQLGRLLAMSTSPAARVRLRILDEAGSSTGSPTLSIARFSDQLAISEDKSFVTGPVDLTFEALRFTDPDTIVPLPIRAPGEAATAPLAGLPGAWMIFGRRGDRIATAPKLRVIAGPTTSISPLCDAMEEPIFASRNAAFETVFAELADTPDSPDWRLVQRLFARLDRFPLATFEALRTLSTVPRALVQALIIAENPVAVVRAYESMPFHWATLPLEALAHGFRTQLRSLDLLLPHFSQASPEARADLLETVFRSAKAALAARYPGSDMLFACASESLPDLVSAGTYSKDEVSMARLAPQQLLAFLDIELGSLRRRHPEAEWPLLDGIEGLRNDLKLPASWKAVTRSYDDPTFIRLVEAPLLAALCAVRVPYRAPTPIEAFALRLAESFDPDYFVYAHPLALALAFAAGAPP